MKISPDAIRAVVNVDVSRRARESFGESGVDAALFLIDKLKLFFQRVPPESIVGTLIVVEPVNDRELEIVPADGVGVRCFGELDDLINTDVCPSRGQTLVVQFRDNEIRTSRSCATFDINVWCKKAIIYRYRDRSEWFDFPVESQRVTPLSASLPSNFCEPTAASLDEALDAYERMARTSHCNLLRDVWYMGGDGPRLVFTNKPEHIMRRSLQNHLSSRLAKGTNVRPEQNTDESHPVDLRVDWFSSTMTALIEIKWLGRSIADGKDGKESYTDYAAWRAREGAKQLAEYIDNEKGTAPDRVLRGYLIVFDGRRKNVTSRHACPNSEEAFYYQLKDIEYNPDFSSTREDFNKPRRYFLEPRRMPLDG